MAKARTKARKPTHEEFVFRVGDPSTSYGFGLKFRDENRDAFFEHQSVSFMADCLYPDRFRGRAAKVRLFGYREQMDMEARQSGAWTPEVVGFMEAGKSRFEVSVSLPLDACWQVGAAMSAGTITSMLLNGPVLSRGKTKLTSVSFHGPDFDPADYIG